MGLIRFGGQVSLHHDGRFKCVRRLIVERRMPPLRIVKAVDIVGHAASPPPGRPAGGAQSLFKVLKKLSTDGIVPTVADATHAGQMPCARRSRLVRGAGILAAAIGVMQQPGRRRRRQRATQRRSDQRCEASGAPPSRRRGATPDRARPRDTATRRRSRERDVGGPHAGSAQSANWRPPDWPASTTHVTLRRGPKAATWPAARALDAHQPITRLRPMHALRGAPDAPRTPIRPRLAAWATRIASQSDIRLRCARHRARPPGIVPARGHASARHSACTG